MQMHLFALGCMGKLKHTLKCNNTHAFNDFSGKIGDAIFSKKSNKFLLNDFVILFTVNFTQICVYRFDKLNILAKAKLVF